MRRCNFFTFANFCKLFESLRLSITSTNGNRLKHVLVILTRLILAGFAKFPAPTSFDTEYSLAVYESSKRSCNDMGLIPILRKGTRTKLEKQNIRLKAEITDYLTIDLAPLQHYCQAHVGQFRPLTKSGSDRTGIFAFWRLTIIIFISLLTTSRR